MPIPELFDEEYVLDVPAGSGGVTIPLWVRRFRLRFDNHHFFGTMMLVGEVDSCGRVSIERTERGKRINISTSFPVRWDRYYWLKEDDP